MTHTSPTHDTTSTDHSTDPSTTSRTTTATEHYSRQHQREPRTKNNSHKIKGLTPMHHDPRVRAGLRPAANRAAPLLISAVDLRKIVSGWSRGAEDRLAATARSTC